MSVELADFEKKFDIQRLAVYRSECWTWSVRPVHSTLGAGILSLNRFCERMSDLTTEEAADLAHITRIIERTLDRFQAPKRMNYVMLMMVDAHLHFHVIPRYSEPRRFAEQDWVDTGWPSLPSLAEGEDVSHAILLQIRDAMKVAINELEPQE